MPGHGHGSLHNAAVSSAEMPRVRTRVRVLKQAFRDSEPRISGSEGMPRVRIRVRGTYMGIVDIGLGLELGVLTRA